MSGKSDDDEFRSDEERQFNMWLIETKEAGLISRFAYEESDFVIHEDSYFDKREMMKTKIKVTEKCNLFENAHHGKMTYTPDFVMELTSRGRRLFGDNIFWRQCQAQDPTSSNIVLVDVKGTFNPYGGTQVFFLKQRMMWARYRLYVSKVVPSSFFKRTWAPASVRYMKNRRTPTLTKIGRSTCTINDYIEKNKWKLESRVYESDNKQTDFVFGA